MSAGRFIVFEGSDGVGKTTQARLLADRLDALLTREPGGTVIGAQIRGLLLSRATHALAPRAEALLMAADRAQHVAEVIRPALAAGRHVVSDRYLYSSVAYQAYGRGLPAAEVRELSLWATEGLQPDLVLLLRGPTRRAAGDRFEDEDDAFHQAVAAGYDAQAEADRQRWAVVEVDGTIAETEKVIVALIADRLGLSC